jgi:transcriptional regulator with XRE-family HTH domain
MPRRSEPDPLAAAIGGRIRAFREARGLRLEQVAFESGLTSKGHLSDLEHGRVNPTVATLRAVAEQLGVGVVDLVNVDVASPRGRLIERSREVSEDLLGRWVAEAEALAPAGEAVSTEAPVIVQGARAPRGTVPVIELGGAGELFEAGRPPVPAGWMKVDARSRALPGAFVAQVHGDAMAPRIPEGAWALFRRPGPGNRRGRVFLVEACGARDSRSHTLQFVETTTVRGQSRMVLRGLNPAHPPRVLDAARSGVRIVAEFVRVIAR